MDAKDPRKTGNAAEESGQPPKTPAKAAGHDEQQPIDTAAPTESGASAHSAAEFDESAFREQDASFETDTGPLREIRDGKDQLFTASREPDSAAMDEAPWGSADADSAKSEVAANLDPLDFSSDPAANTASLEFVAETSESVLARTPTDVTPSMASDDGPGLADTSESFDSLRSDPAIWDMDTLAPADDLESISKSAFADSALNGTHDLDEKAIVPLAAEFDAETPRVRENFLPIPLSMQQSGASEPTGESAPRLYLEITVQGAEIAAQEAVNRVAQRIDQMIDERIDEKINELEWTRAANMRALIGK